MFSHCHPWLFNPRSPTWKQQLSHPTRKGLGPRLCSSAPYYLKILRHVPRVRRFSIPYKPSGARRRSSQCHCLAPFEARDALKVIKMCHEEHVPVALSQPCLLKGCSLSKKGPGTIRQKKAENEKGTLSNENASNSGSEYFFTCPVSSIQLKSIITP